MFLISGCFFPITFVTLNLNFTAWLLADVSNQVDCPSGKITNCWQVKDNFDISKQAACALCLLMKGFCSQVVVAWALVESCGRTTSLFPDWYTRSALSKPSRELCLGPLNAAQAPWWWQDSLYFSLTSAVCWAWCFLRRDENEVFCFLSFPGLHACVVIARWVPARSFWFWPLPYVLMEAYTKWPDVAEPQGEALPGREATGFTSCRSRTLLLPHKHTHTPYFLRRSPGFCVRYNVAEILQHTGYLLLMQFPFSEQDSLGSFFFLFPGQGLICFENDWMERERALEKREHLWIPVALR